MQRFSINYTIFILGSYILIPSTEAPAAGQTIDCHYENSGGTAKISVGISNDEDYVVKCNWACTYTLEDSNFTKQSVAGEDDVDQHSSKNVHSDSTPATVSGASGTPRCARK